MGEKDTVTERRWAFYGALMALAFLICLAICPLRAHAVQLHGSSLPASGQHGIATAPSAAKAVNAKGRASKLTLFSYGWSNGAYHSATSKTLRAYDVTGDGARDKVRVSVLPAVGAPGRAASVSIAVSGCQTYVVRTKAADIDLVDVQLVTLRNNEPFLYVAAYRVNGAPLQALLQCQGERFVCVAGQDLVGVQGVSDARVSGLAVAGNRVIVQYDFVSSVTGHTRTSFGYSWNGSTLARQSSASTALRYATTVSGGFTRLARKAVRSFTAHARPTLDGASFRVAAGKSVRPDAVRVSGGTLVYRMQYGKKRGWVACPPVAPVGVDFLLKGVYGAFSLSDEPLRYKAGTAYSAAALQKLSNHALFVMRNEIFARKGYEFSNPELAAVFGECSWYRPKSASVVKLTKAQRSNAELILAIEKNRKSPYVS